MPSRIADINRRIDWVEQVRSIADDAANRIMCTFRHSFLLVDVLDAQLPPAGWQTVDTSV
jgi:hypothetical protein